MDLTDQAIRSAVQDSTKAARRRGQQRAREILETAQDILANEGYHSLTLRRISERLGISKGNLTYYFSNKEVLLRAMITDTLARYEDAMSNALANPKGDHKANLMAFCAVLIDDSRTPKSHRFFYQLWALSTHNEEVAQYRSQIYEHYLAQMKTALRAALPDIDEKLLLKKSFVLMALLEGLNVMFGSSKEYQASFSDLDNYLEEQIAMIIES